MSQHINTYFGTSPELRQLSGKAGQLLFLQKLYQQVAPVSLIRFSHVQHLEQNILTIAADNGAVAAKLRQLVPELTKQLNNLGCKVTGIRVKVQVTLPNFEPILTLPILSPTAQKQLNELAEALPESPLKSAVQRLSKKQNR